MSRYLRAMKPDGHAHLRALLDRLCRLAAQDDWQQDLNPAQQAALSYLARANRFSRSPSQVADYLMSTRGTVSQTLKALARKGLLREVPVPGDKRSRAYDLTPEGEAALNRVSSLSDSLAELPKESRLQLQEGLERLLTATLRARGNRPFGLCRDCRHHRAQGQAAFCTLLQEPLSTAEIGQICHEQEPV